MEFEEIHAGWLQSHLDRRRGERRGRLKRGHQHGEMIFLRNVWWPFHGNLDNLHPEYEILDWRGRSYFADFAWLPGYCKLIFEIKGYGAHVRDMDRQRYCDELNRETFLQGLGFRVVSFAYDDIAHRPELSITLLRLLLSRYQPEAFSVRLCDLGEKEIVLLAFQLARPIRPRDVEMHLHFDHRTAVRWLQSLCSKGWLQPILSPTGARILKYQLIKRDLDELHGCKR